MRPFLLLILPAIALAEQTPKEPPPTLRLCTGSVGNTYHRVGTILKEKLGGALDLKVIETRGSWENLERIDAEPRQCDAVIAQDDAYALYQFEKPKSSLTMDRVATLYPEYVHLLCHRSVDTKGALGLDAKKHRVLVNEYGSGTYITWSLLGRLNRRFARLRSSEVAIDEGLLKIADGVAAHCMVFVSGLGAGSLKRANDRLGGKLKLIGLVDEALQRKVGRDRRQVYRRAEIPAGTYPKLTTEAVPTQAVDAIFFVSPEWKARHPAGSKRLAATLIEIIPSLQAAGSR